MISGSNSRILQLFSFLQSCANIDILLDTITHRPSLAPRTSSRPRSVWQHRQRLHVVNQQRPPRHPEHQQRHPSNPHHRTSTIPHPHPPPILDPTIPPPRLPHPLKTRTTKMKLPTTFDCYPRSTQNPNPRAHLVSSFPSEERKISNRPALVDSPSSWNVAERPCFKPCLANGG